MKKMMKLWVVVLIGLLMQSQTIKAQKIDDERMKRDIEVAENVLSTLIKQELNQKQGFFGIEIKGSYLPGYGVTFRLPGDFSASFVFAISGENRTVTLDRDRNGYSYTMKRINKEGKDKSDDEDEEEELEEDGEVYKLKDKQKTKNRENIDSLRDQYNLKLIKASKDFILDYGDFISQLGPDERIIITNQGDQQKGWYFQNTKRTHLSVEGLRSDINAFKQGKINRDQALAKIKVINTESVEVKEPDMELLSSIFSRLYRADLAKTYFTEENIYYERLRDYGVIYSMHVYSSNQMHGEGDSKRFSMPTIDMENLDQAARDKKVIEMYPKFEQELKENILEYGRTLKSLKDEELVAFNVILTKCKGCNIPSSVEVSVKSSVLKDFGAGKMDKNAALAKFTVKKGPNQ